MNVFLVILIAALAASTNAIKLSPEMGKTLCNTISNHKL